MPLPLSNLQISQLAFNEAKRASQRDQGAPDLSEHYLRDLEYVYVPQALTVMADRTTWDPLEDAPGSAQVAVIEYCKLVLLGINPETDKRFVDKLEQWQKAAARAVDYDDAYEDYPDWRKRIRDNSKWKFPRPSDDA